jgi:hypothetical protein
MGRETPVVEKRLGVVEHLRKRNHEDHHISGDFAKVGKRETYIEHVLESGVIQDHIEVPPKPVGQRLREIKGDFARHPLKPSFSGIVGDGVRSCVHEVVAIMTALLVPVVPRRDVHHVASKQGRDLPELSIRPPTRQPEMPFIEDMA